MHQHDVRAIRTKFGVKIHSQSFTAVFIPIESGNHIPINIYPVVFCQRAIICFFGFYIRLIFIKVLVIVQTGILIIILVGTITYFHHRSLDSRLDLFCRRRCLPLQSVTESQGIYETKIKSMPYTFVTRKLLRPSTRQ